MRKRPPILRSEWPWTRFLADRSTLISAEKLRKLYYILLYLDHSTDAYIHFSCFIFLFIFFSLILAIFYRIHSNISRVHDSVSSSKLGHFQVRWLWLFYSSMKLDVKTEIGTRLHLIFLTHRFQRTEPQGITTTWKLCFVKDL